MTIKHILLPLTGEPDAADAAVCALSLARTLKAHVTASFEDHLGALTVPPDLVVTGSQYGGFYDQLQQVRVDRRAKAREIFDKAVKATSLPIVSAPLCTQGSAMWVDDADDALVSGYGPLTDLVVLGAPGNQNSPPAWQVAETAMFGARRPVVIVPKGTKSLNFANILVAWNGSAEVAQAVTRAIDLMPSDAKITVLQVGNLKKGHMPAERAMDYFGWHCFAPELRRVPDRPAETSGIILDEVRRAGATAIVMGAYTHSRTRELLFGGVTDFMLRYALTPVLMAH